MPSWIFSLFEGFPSQPPANVSDSHASVVEFTQSRPNRSANLRIGANQIVPEHAESEFGAASRRPFPPEA